MRAVPEERAQRPLTLLRDAPGRALFGDRWPRCIAVIGAGGKTSVLLALAREAARERRVVITTTTHMWRPDGALALAGSAQEAAQALETQPVVWAALPAEDSRKIRGLPEAERLRLGDAAGLVLAEADGSRGLPLKLTAPWEPAIPPEAEHALILLGLDALGERLDRVCHRWELAKPLGLEGESPVTPEAAARILRHSYLTPLAERFPALPYTVLLNKADDPQRLGEAQTLAALLPDCRCFAVSLR